MKVEKLREIFEVQDIAELKPDVKYLVRYLKPLTMDSIRAIQQQFDGSSLHVFVVGPEFEFYEIKD